MTKAATAVSPDTPGKGAAMNSETPDVEMRNGYVMVRDLDLKETVSARSGLILPKDKYQRLSEVVAVPKGVKGVSVGDIVIKPVGFGTPVTIDGVEYECIKADRLFARVRKRPE